MKTKKVTSVNAMNAWYLRLRDHFSLQEIEVVAFGDDDKTVLKHFLHNFDKQIPAFEIVDSMLIRSPYTAILATYMTHKPLFSAS